MNEQEVAIPKSEVSELYIFDKKTKTHRKGTKKEISEEQNRIDEKVKIMNEKSKQKSVTKLEVYFLLRKLSNAAYEEAKEKALRYVDTGDEEARTQAKVLHSRVSALIEASHYIFAVEDWDGYLQE